MPLRDHFKPPVTLHSHWEGFHAYWPSVILDQLYEVLPAGYSVEPRVRLGRDFEIDIGTSEDRLFSSTRVGAGGVATLDAPAATTSEAVAFHDPATYEVQVYDDAFGRKLVAAIELVSPGNQDRPERREAFLDKCEGLVSKGVCVSMIDIVTPKRFNLHAELLERFGVAEAAFAHQIPNTYMTTCRRRDRGSQSRLESWAYPLTVGQPFPLLPVWLDDSTLLQLDVESTYEKACRRLRIP